MRLSVMSLARLLFFQELEPTFLNLDDGLLRVSLCLINDLRYLNRAE